MKEHKDLFKGGPGLDAWSNLQYIRDLQRRAKEQNDIQLEMQLQKMFIRALKDFQVITQEPEEDKIDFPKIRAPKMPSLKEQQASLKRLQEVSQKIRKALDREHDQFMKKQLEDPRRD